LAGMSHELLTLPSSAEWQRLHTRERDVLSGREKLVALIRNQGGGDADSLLAKPEFDQDGDAILGWRSPYGGRLVPAEGDEGHKALAERIAMIAERLDGQGDAGQLAAHSLRSALVTPEGVSAHFVDSGNGMPVLVNWGMALPGQERPFLPEAAETSRADAAVAATHRTAGASGGTAGIGLEVGALPSATALKPKHRRGMLFVLPWLISAALAVLLVWLGLQAMEPLPLEIVEIAPETPLAPDPLFGLEARLAAIDAAIAEAETAAPHFAEVCVAPEPLPLRPTHTPPATEPEKPVAEVPAEAPQDETVALAPQDNAPPEAPSPQPKPPPKTRVEPQRPALVQPAEREPTARAACKPNWPPGRSPRMVFVVDGSGSMRDTIPGASSRMTASKRSISRVVKSLHNDIRIGMVSFSDCGATQNSRYYAAPERGQLLGRVNAMRPGRKTSLAASIRRAGALATSRAETVIVVVSDGEDTCGSDPCAAARSVRSQKPNVKINVIDLSGGAAAGALQCIARSGGGRVFTPQSAGQMSSQLQQATGQPDASGC
jgi:hypothetical protein